MIKITKTISCDICNNEIKTEKLTKQDSYNLNVTELQSLCFDSEFKTPLGVIFTTDQTEGRPVEPHLVIENLTICKKCTSKILEGNALFAHGAQGFNTYYFKEKKNEI